MRRTKMELLAGTVFFPKRRRSKANPYLIITASLLVVLALSIIAYMRITEVTYERVMVGCVQ